MINYRNLIPAFLILTIISPVICRAQKVSNAEFLKQNNIEVIVDKGAQDDLSSDSFTGNWLDESKNIVLQVFKNDEGLYRAILKKDFFSLDPPDVVLTTNEINKGALKLQGPGTSVEMSGKGVILHYKGESLPMKMVNILSPTLNAPVPENGLVLFDGSCLDMWTKHAPKKWLTPAGPADNWKITEDKSLEVVPGSGSIISKKEFSDFHLHVEFRLLGEETNGGVYLLSRYEINIKDSYGQISGAPCGSLGNISNPANLLPPCNMALPPFHWQTFDIDFTAPKFNSAGEKTEDALFSLKYNGVQIYDKVKLKSVRGAASRLGEASSGPIYLQDHGTAYQFKNIWIVEKNRD